ncbi:MAG: hypothetical protein D8M18_04655 [Bacteroidetes bacterium]|nr:hypothetical protein [Bacteroidota bacterium]
MFYFAKRKYIKKVAYSLSVNTYVPIFLNRGKRKILLVRTAYALFTKGYIVNFSRFKSITI